MKSLKKNNISKLKGILEEFHKEEILEALSEMEISFPTGYNLSSSFRFPDTSSLIYDEFFLGIQFGKQLSASLQDVPRKCEGKCNGEGLVETLIYWGQCTDIDEKDDWKEIINRAKESTEELADKMEDYLKSLARRKANKYCSSISEDRTCKCKNGKYEKIESHIETFTHLLHGPRCWVQAGWKYIGNCEKE